MYKEYLDFIHKTDELLRLLDFFSHKEAVPDSLTVLYSDFYLKNIISNNYTHFETFLRNCLTIIVEKLSQFPFVDKEMISEELAYDIIEKCIHNFPVSKQNYSRFYEEAKKKSALYLSNMLNEGKFIVRIEDHSFVQFKHSVPEIEKILCKYFNQKKILHNILLKNNEQCIFDFERLDDESAFAFLNRYTQNLRHPIVHQGICLYMNEEMSIHVDDAYVQVSLEHFKYIAEQLYSIFNDYFQKLVQIQYDSKVSKNNRDDIGKMIGS